MCRLWAIGMIYDGNFHVAKERNETEITSSYRTHMKIINSEDGVVVFDFLHGDDLDRPKPIYRNQKINIFTGIQKVETIFHSITIPSCAIQYITK